MKKTIIIIIALVAVLAIGATSILLIKKNQENILDSESFEFVGVVDLSDSGLGMADLPELNMNFEFSDGLEFDFGGASNLSFPEISFQVPEVPRVERFAFSESALQSSFASQSVESKQASEEAEASAQAEAEAREAAEAEARAEAGAPPAQTETTTPPPSQEATPPAQTGPSSADCAQFDSAPSCDYVPASVRDVCLQCKAR